MTLKEHCLLHLATPTAIFSANWRASLSITWFWHTVWSDWKQLHVSTVIVSSVSLPPSWRFSYDRPCAASSLKWALLAVNLCQLLFKDQDEVVCERQQCKWPEPVVGLLSIWKFAGCRSLWFGNNCNCIHLWQFDRHTVLVQEAETH